jgi:hypothetical protein
MADEKAYSVELVEEANPDWADLWPELMGQNVTGPLSHLQNRAGGPG